LFSENNLCTNCSELDTRVYIGGLYTWILMNRTLNYANSKLTAQLEYFVIKCMLCYSDWGRTLYIHFYRCSILCISDYHEHSSPQISLDNLGSTVCDKVCVNVFSTLNSANMKFHNYVNKLNLTAVASFLKGFILFKFSKGGV